MNLDIFLSGWWKQKLFLAPCDYEGTIASVYFYLFWDVLFSLSDNFFLHGCQYSADYLRRTFCRSLSSLFLKLSPLQYLSWKKWGTLASMDFLQLSESAVLSLDLPFLCFVAWNITQGNNWSNLSFIFFMFHNSVIIFLCCLI